MDELTQTFELLSGEVSLALVALGATLLHFLVEPIRWWLVLTRRESVSFATTFHVFSTTALLSYTLPFKMGLPVRHMLLKRTLRQSHFLIGSALFLDALLVYLTWALAAGITLLTVAASRPDEISVSPVGFIVLAVAAGIVILGILKFRRTNPVQRAKVALTDLRDLLTFRTAAVALGTIVFDLFVQGIKHWAIFSLFGLEIGLGDAFGIAIVSITVGMLSFMPLGLGVYDAVLVALIAASTGSGTIWLVPIVSRVLSVVVAATLGSLGAAKLGINFRDRSWRDEATHPSDRSN